MQHGRVGFRPFVWPRFRSILAFRYFSKICGKVCFLGGSAPDIKKKNILENSFFGQILFRKSILFHIFLALTKLLENVFFIFSFFVPPSHVAPKYWPSRKRLEFSTMGFLSFFRPTLPRCVNSWNATRLGGIPPAPSPIPIRSRSDPIPIPSDPIRSRSDSALIK